MSVSTNKTAVRKLNTPSIPSLNNIDPALFKILSPIKQILESGVLPSIEAQRQVIEQNIAQNAGAINESNISEYLPSWILNQTNPSKPANVTALPAIGGIVISWNYPNYNQHNYTEIWRSPTSSFSSAVRYAQADGNLYFDKIDSPTTYYYWIRFVSLTGLFGDYHSATPVSAISYAYKVGLAPGDITSTLLAAGAVDITKMASGLRPPRVVSSLPTVDGVTYANGDTVVLTTDGKLYRAVSGSFTKAVDGADILANSITAGSILAGAIGTSQLAADAVTAAKLYVGAQGKALNQDAACSDATAWVGGGGSGSFSIATITDGVAGGKCLRLTNDITVNSARFMTVTAGKRYKIHAYLRKTSGGGVCYLRTIFYDGTGAQLNYVANAITPAIGSFENITLSASWVEYVGYIDAGTSAVKALVSVVANWTGSGVTDIQDLRLEEYIDGTLISDGAITTNKVAANAISAAKIDTADLAANSAFVNSLVANTAYVNSLSASNAFITNLTAQTAFFTNLKANMVGANQITATNIDTRNLTVRDNLGNIILGVGNPLPVSYAASGLVNSNISIGSNGALSGGGGGQATLSGMGMPIYNIKALGADASASSYPSGNYGFLNGDTGAIIYSLTSVYTVLKITRSTGAVTLVGTYYTYSSPSTAAAMATALNGISSNYIVVVYSYDEPQSSRLTNGLDAAMYRHGASRAVFGSPNFKYRSAYVLIGIGACGEGNGFEAYAGDIDSDPNAWVDVSFTVRNGLPIVSGATKTPNQISDYGYVGDLNATNGAPAGTLVAGVSATSVGTAATGYNGQVTSFTLGGSQTSFYPVLIQSNILGGAAYYDLTVSRPSVHQDGTWLGSYTCHIYARGSSYGNANGAIVEIDQVTGSGTYTSGVSDVYTGLVNNGILVMMRGGMTHTVSLSQPIGAFTITPYIGGYSDATAGTINPTTTGTLLSYLNTAYCPSAPVNWSASVAGSGKPQDNATVGAQAGVNLKDSGGTLLVDSAIKNSAFVGVTINSNGIQVSNTATGQTFFDANASSPPWVVNAPNVGSGVALAKSKDSNNNAPLRSLLATGSTTVATSSDGNSVVVTGLGSEIDSIYEVSDLTLSSTLSDVSQFVMTIPAVGGYVLRGTLGFSLSATATITLGFNLPTSDGSLRIVAQTSTTSFPTIAAIASATSISATTASLAAGFYAVSFELYISAATTGSAQLRAAVSAGTGVLKIGSAMTLQKISRVTVPSPATLKTAATWGLSNKSGLWSVTYPMTVATTLTFYPNGTWAITGSGYGMVTDPALSGTWLTGASGSSGSGFEIQIVETAFSGSGVSTHSPPFNSSNSAASYVSLASTQSYSVIVSTDYSPTGTTYAIGTLTINIRPIGGSAQTYTGLQLQTTLNR